MILALSCSMVALTVGAFAFGWWLRGSVEADEARRWHEGQAALRRTVR